MSIAKELIDRVDEVTLESELSVINSLSKVYAKQAYMISQCDNLDALDAVFTEADTPAADAQQAAAPAGSAKTGTAKKGLLRKMFEAVKKFFSLIARGLKLIVKLLGNIFRLPGKDKKTMKQILAECGFGKRADADKGTQAAEKYQIEFKGDDAFIIKYKFYKGEANSRKNKAGGAPVYQDAARHENAAVELLADEKYRNAFFTYVQSFIDFLKKAMTDRSFNNDEWRAVLDNDYRIPGRPGGNDEQVISYKTLVEVQSKINTLQRDFDSINYEQYDAFLAGLDGSDRDNFNRRVSRAMGILTSRLNNIQMSFNALSNEIAHAFDLPTEYYGTVNTPEALESFVQKCVEGGVPPRYVIHGIMKISTDDLKGPHQPAGQSRVVLFPKNDQAVVYKVAYNGFGISSNKAEIAVCKAITKHHPPEKLIADVTKAYGNGYVIAMERANGKKPNLSQLREVRRKFEKFEAQAHTGLPTGDLHENNVSQMPSGEWVSIDYGWSAREQVSTR